ncbi:signal peptidase I [Nocardioides perillae]|uniref:Signal peptidase I n=1 Tax=Nocardioides perillae TaxID=1119534 RepID=A0A7Y9UMZ2_9ACTN|nr:signal peptidase I [Nocardioides perillae]NYG56652.1 signal peptidase [Nocardioides perillae]
MSLLSTPAAHRARTVRGRIADAALNLGILVVVLVALGFLLPSLLGYERYVITGGSMSGTYEIGSVVFEEVVPVEDLRVGDVITYVPPAESGIANFVTHRIVDVDGDEFVTRGDANADVDPWTFQLTAATQPRVVASVPHVGWVFLALADRGTRMAVIGIPAALIALMALAELVRALRAPREEEPTADELVAALAAEAAAERTPVAV